MASGAVAQSPSPDPPPWFGGRVEMPEYGFAVTLPDGWVGFDLRADADAQVDVLESRLDSWPAGVFAWLREHYATNTTVGVHIDATDFSEYLDHQFDPRHCTFRAKPVPGKEYTDQMYEGVMADEWVTESEPPTEVLLPAGRGWTFAAEFQPPDLPGTIYSVATYIAEGEEFTLTAYCSSMERPEDDWLSIAETLEFLPAE